MAMVPVALCNWPTVTSLSVTACPVVVAGSAWLAEGQPVSVTMAVKAKPSFIIPNGGLELNFRIGSPVFKSLRLW
jgi:hypothetical protein